MPRNYVAARQFDGAEEGRQHWGIKRMLCESLSADPDFQGIEIERYLRPAEPGTGRGRFPDVQAIHRPSGRRVIFEVQIANYTPDILIDREQFYESEGHLFFWIVPAAALLPRNISLSLVAKENMFVVNEATWRQSIAEKRFVMEVTFPVRTTDAKPAGAQPSIVSDDGTPYFTRFCSLDDLKLAEPQPAFPFYFDATKDVIDLARSLRGGVSNYVGNSIIVGEAIRRVMALNSLQIAARMEGAVRLIERLRALARTCRREHDRKHPNWNCLNASFKAVADCGISVALASVLARHFVKRAGGGNYNPKRAMAYVLPDAPAHSSEIERVLSYLALPKFYEEIWSVGPAVSCDQGAMGST